MTGIPYLRGVFPEGLRERLRREAKARSVSLGDMHTELVQTFLDALDNVGSGTRPLMFIAAPKGAAMVDVRPTLQQIKQVQASASTHQVSVRQWLYSAAVFYEQTL